jgi:hypothetical protein
MKTLYSKDSKEISDTGVFLKPVGIGLREVDKYGRPVV